MPDSAEQSIAKRDSAERRSREAEGRGRGKAKTMHKEWTRGRKSSARAGVDAAGPAQMYISNIPNILPILPIPAIPNILFFSFIAYEWIIPNTAVFRMIAMNGMNDMNDMNGMIAMNATY